MMNVIMAFLRWLTGLFGRGGASTGVARAPEIIYRPSPHFSDRESNAVSMIIIHGDAGETDEGTISWIQDPKSRVSYHYLVGRDGRVYQFVADRHKAWHAGVSHWEGREIGNSVNPISLGVCFANDGTGDEPYRPIQYEKGRALLQSLMSRHGVKKKDVLGHFQVSPGRKSDPWDHFDWGALWER